jgi:HlyD family type I secretion membrane fusion protein
MSAATSHWSAGVRTSVRGPLLLVLATAGIGMGGFLAWGGTAPLAGAVVAPGHIAASGENQVVQHLEGGIVTALHVREGDRVAAGQPLITLDPTIVESNLNRLRKGLAVLRIEEARLLAEQHDLDELRFPPDLLAADLDASLKEVVASKLHEFETRRLMTRNEVQILLDRIAGLQQEIKGYEAQRVATQKQAGFVRDELRGVDSLFEKGYARQDRLFILRRTEADLDGRDGALLSSIGKARQSVAETRQQIEKLGHDRRTTAATKLSDLRGRMAEVMEQIRAGESVVTRLVIRAPIDGTIVRAAANTVGAVITPAQTLVELLPAGAELVVEARLPPSDVDAVRPGQPADIRLSALNQRVTPVVHAQVTYVSADKLTDKEAQQTYYRVRLAIAPDQLPAAEQAKVVPGMPVDAMIMTAERTMLEYLFRPILDSVSRAFREE